MTKPRTPEEIAEEWFKIHDGMCVRSIDGQPYKEHFLAALREAADAARCEERNRAWLIELPRSNGSPLWYGKRPGFEGWWVEDANHAIRFARREDAEQARLYLHDGHLARVSDHVWLDARSRAEEPR